MLFCPTCANILLIETTDEDFRFFCRTCPYIYKVESRLEQAAQL
jgi:DNA-directed RNA polymerase III subunit RPC11